MFAHHVAWPACSAWRASVLRRVVRAAVVMPLTALHIACSAPARLATGPYAHCVNLEDIALISHSKPDAEQRMTARVIELGGDTLLFGERGRSEQLNDVPQEIVERRSELTSSEPNAGQPRIVTTSPDPLPADVPQDVVESSGGRPRIPRISVDQVPAAQGELWYYGAALRCKPTDAR